MAKAFRREADRRSNLTGAQKTPIWATATGTENIAVGTSIFDPVLCELVYRWFSPSGAKVLDPFAGGSVRGIVAGHLGREYIGVELRPEQVEANRIQAEQLFGRASDEPVEVRVSGKWLRHCFACSVEYIRQACHGRCCEGSDRVLVSLLPEEEQRQKALGHQTVDGLLQPDEGTGLCPHKTPDGLCALHGTEDKPFGCIASPFTLNKGDMLIIRNRYARMKCHGKGDPAYKVFADSLRLIFGDVEAERIAQAAASGADQIDAVMPRSSHQALHYLDGLKHGERTTRMVTPRWLVGDAVDVLDLAPGDYDLLFSCPPYYDLEVYSDLPGELSALASYSEFLEVYRTIIERAVSLLKDDRFACFVVGSLRDADGHELCLPCDTIRAFEDAGLRLFNSAVLVTAVGSLPVRVIRYFGLGRKLGRTHQHVLIFVKGDWRKAVEACGEIDVEDIIDGLIEAEPEQVHGEPGTA